MVFFLFCGCLSGGWVLAGEGRWEEPWPKRPPGPGPESQTPSTSLSPGQKAAQGVLRLFQEYISPVDGDRCPCYPTCSQYSVEAIRKHGVWIGLVMTFDRLIHESSEIRQAPLVKVYGSYRYYDPVENNDFWWNKGSIQRSAISDQPSAVSKERQEPQLTAER
ncbi:MAG TPA: membrane protein insertion efficiency factor YidD [Thermodesulfobacteriota bacterium]|nr:membrane protein insertion efficiency factor YidD [Thermodesulfobacteriota bacterium]